MYIPIRLVACSLNHLLLKWYDAGNLELKDGEADDQALPLLQLLLHPGFG